MMIIRHILLAFAAFFLAFPAMAMPAFSGATDWVRTDFARTRLLSDRLALDGDGGNTLVLGWEIELPQGWKTYWRSPGEAGLPTRLNWDGSSNVESAELLYPLPERFEIFGIHTYGYDSRVILPIKVKLKDPKAPVHFKANVSFMVCMDICVPLDASYEVQLDHDGQQGASPFADDIQASLRQVPRLGPNPLYGLDYDVVNLTGEPGNQRLIIDVMGSRLLTGADVIVEAPKEFRIGLPYFSLMNDGKDARFVVPIGSGRHKKSLENQPLIITVSDGWGQAVEIPHTLAERANID